MWNRTLRNKMILFIALPTLIIYITSAVAIWYYLVRQRIHEIESELRYVSETSADKFGKILQQAAGVADMTAKSAGLIEDLNENKIYQLLESNVRRLPFIYGACMAFDPQTLKPDDSLYAPYVYKTEGGIERMNITREVYDWYSDPRWEWFRMPKMLRRGYWTKPYFDEGAGNVRMITYSAPFYRDGRFAGVTTVDIRLGRLKEVVLDEGLSTLKFEVLTSEGVYIYSDRADRIMHKTVFEIAREHGRPDWEKFGRRVTSGESGMVRIRGILSPEKYWAYHIPMASTGWHFVSRITEKQAMGGLRRQMAITFLAIFWALFLITGSIIFMAGLITRPIAKLNRKVLEVAGGNLDVKGDGIRSQDEIGTLARNFDKMTADLRTHVKRQGELGRLQRDLQLAKEIQRSTLPKTIPPLPGFDVGVWSEPAGETGGDTYDIVGYQVIPEGKSVHISAKESDRAILLLADATGHGIGPALSVTQLRAMLRMATHISPDISVIAEHANEQLCADLPGGRFITAWLGEINTNDNTLRSFSAGQGPLVHYDHANDAFRLLKANTYPFGITGKIDTEHTDLISFDHGDIFAVISDGIYEAVNPEGEPFGTDRVLEVIRRRRDAPVREILDTLREALNRFTQNAVPEDDRTGIFIKRV